MSLEQVRTLPTPFPFISLSSFHFLHRLLGCTALCESMIPLSYIQLRFMSKGAGSEVLESRQAGSGWTCSLPLLQHGCAGGNIRLVGAGHVWDRTLTWLFLCIRVLLSPSLCAGEDEGRSSSTPWTEVKLFWEVRLHVLGALSPCKSGKCRSQRKHQKHKATMCFSQGNGKTCKPPQAVSALKSGFGTLHPVTCMLSQRATLGCQLPSWGAQGLSATCVWLPPCHRHKGMGLHEGTWVFLLQRVPQGSWKSWPEAGV